MRAAHLEDRSHFEETRFLIFNLLLTTNQAGNFTNLIDQSINFYFFDHLCSKTIFSFHTLLTSSLSYVIDSIGTLYDKSCVTSEIWLFWDLVLVRL